MPVPWSTGVIPSIVDACGVIMGGWKIGEMRGVLTNACKASIVPSRPGASLAMA